MEKHVYFYSLPLGTEFIHKGDKYIKIEEEKVKEISNNKKWTFEAHYGCLISDKKFKELELTEDVIRPL